MTVATPKNSKQAANKTDDVHKADVQEIDVHKIVAWCDALLGTQQFKDYCPNGLQVDAGKPVQKVVTGVTASMALIEAAIAANAQAILVHHGYFWKGEPATLTGMKGQRIRKLMQHGISLVAYHLPLDAHPVHGNNAQLANLLGLSLAEPLFAEFEYNKDKVGDIATLAEPMPAQALYETITAKLAREPLHIVAHGRDYQRIGICTGAAQDFISQAAAMGCDAFISGEVSERTTHEAKELGVDYFACGHHATEKGGVQSLGTALAQHFGIPVQFIDIDNPV